jgi:hypothetical protein
MIRMRVLGLEASHLLLIRTNLGCWTILTAALARLGFSATLLLLLLLLLLLHHWESLKHNTWTYLRLLNEKTNEIKLQQN